MLKKIKEMILGFKLGFQKGMEDKSFKQIVKEIANEHPELRRK